MYKEVSQRAEILSILLMDIFHVPTIETDIGDVQYMH